MEGAVKNQEVGGYIQDPWAVYPCMRRTHQNIQGWYHKMMMKKRGK